METADTVRPGYLSSVFEILDLAGWDTETTEAVLSRLSESISSLDLKADFVPGEFEGIDCHVAIEIVSPCRDDTAVSVVIRFNSQQSDCKYSKEYYSIWFDINMEGELGRVTRHHHSPPVDPQQAHLHEVTLEAARRVVKEQRAQLRARLRLQGKEISGREERACFTIMLAELAEREVPGICDYLTGGSFSDQIPDFINIGGNPVSVEAVSGSAFLERAIDALKQKYISV